MKKIVILIGHLCFKVALITSEVELPILNYYLLCYFNTTIQLLHQIITISLCGNHEYNLRSKDTTNADQPDQQISSFQSSI